VTRESGDRLGRARDGIVVSGIRLGALSLVVASVYALVVLGIGDAPTSRQWTLLAFSALAAVLVGFVYARLDPRISAWARTLVNRRAGDSGDVVRLFSRRAAGGLPLDELLAALVESLRVGLSVRAAEVWTHAGGVLQLAASDPSRCHSPVILRATEEAALAHAGVVGDSWLELWLPALAVPREAVRVRVAAMVQSGELIGAILVERDLGLPAFSRDDDETLALLSRQAALAFGNLRLGSALDASMEELRQHAEALRESRTRLVTAADAERRRIERDLHDGAQQHLLGLAVNLKFAREIGPSDPARAAAILADLSAEVHAALDNLRELAHGIYPPLLAERGVVDALRGTMARVGVSGSVQAGQVDRYLPEVEATVYFCCVEALQNAAKHAPGAHVAVRLWSADGALMFAVEDDGPGFDTNRTTEGVGVTNMRDRVGALGGSIQLDTRQGSGTRITGAVPLVSAPALRDTGERP
jgi:signal transduction histidine kinase